MAMNFPDNPSVNDEFTVGDQTWVWTGTTWDTVTITEYSPSAHATTHELGGTDELTIAQSQVTNLTTDLADKADASDFTGGTEGQVVLSDGTSGVKFETGYLPRETVYFTSSGSFSKGDYPWLKAMRVKVQGAGGAGGGGENTSSGQVSVGGGGAGGMYAESFITNISGLDNTISVDIGAGGSGNVAATGDNGGTSSFGSLVSAEGGGPGLASVAFFGEGLGPAGNPERSATGDLVIFGSTGSFGLGVGDTTGRVRGGIGGASHLGGGGTVFSNNNGRSGGLYGGGGSGGRSVSGNGTGTGGDGADGIVILELFA